MHRSARSTIVLALLAVGCSALTPQSSLAQTFPSLEGFDPSGLVRFSNLEQAETRRKKLVQYIWPAGLPISTLPERQASSRQVYDEDLAGIDAQATSSVERLIATVEPYGFHSTMYLLHPTVQNANGRRLLIVHSGHRRDGPLDAGIETTVNHFLKSGFRLLVVDMPLVGWNRDARIRVAQADKSIDIDARGTRGHNEIFARLAAAKVRDGEAFRLFLEPIVQGVNHFRRRNAENGEVSMIGLSGGGWATHMAAAVDKRIRFSFPVAGAYPLYARRLTRGSWGDAEQNHPPLYGERDDDGDGVTETATGVASWLEIFALGGIGPNRLQVQILNLEDPCCFSTEIYKSYEPLVAKVVQACQQGGFQVKSDRTHKRHVISSAAINEFVMSVLTGRH